MTNINQKQSAGKNPAEDHTKSNSGIPELILQSMDADGLRWLLARINKTRRKNFPFALNGRVVLPARSWARNAVISEIHSRSGG